VDLHDSLLSLSTLASILAASTCGRYVVGSASTYLAVRLLVFKWDGIALGIRASEGCWDAGSRRHDEVRARGGNRHAVFGACGGIGDVVGLERVVGGCWRGREDWARHEGKGGVMGFGAQHLLESEQKDDLPLLSSHTQR